MKNISFKETIRMQSAFTIFTFATFGLLVLIIGILYISNQSLRNTIKTRVYVAVDGQMYAANPQIKNKRDVLDYEVFTKTFAYNMFGHDINTLDQRLQIVEPLIYSKGYHYIFSSLYTTGKDAGWQDGLNNIRELYKRRDARSFFEVDSISSNISDKLKQVNVYGVQKAVFAVGEPSEASIDFTVNIEDCDKSEKNPWGLKITKFSFIN